MEEAKKENELNLEVYIVGSLPTLFYIPNFITESEQSQLLHHIYEVTPSRWKSLKNRRLQNWGGLVHEKGLLPQELPPWLTKITQKICQQTGLFPSAINHVLVNEYLPDQGIMPHQDGPAYFPVVAILSLGSPVVIDFTPHKKLIESTSNEIKKEEFMELGAGKSETDTSSNMTLCREENDSRDCSLLLTPCSLLIFKDQAYSDYLHGIQDTELHRLDKIGCALIGSLGALFNGVLLINLVIALFALVAIESNSQTLARTYAGLLISAIMLDILWFILFTHTIWNIAPQKYGEFFVFSVRLALSMQIIGFSIRLCSSFLWIQIYRLGVSSVNNTIYRGSEFYIRNNFMDSPAHEISRQNSTSDDNLSGSIYDQTYFSSILQDANDKSHSYEESNHVIDHEWNFMNC